MQMVVGIVDKETWSWEGEKEKENSIWLHQVRSTKGSFWKGSEWDSEKWLIHALKFKIKSSHLAWIKEQFLGACSVMIKKKAQVQ